MNTLQLQGEIEVLRQELASSDYKTIKQIEQSCYTPEKWEEIKTEREGLRERIRKYESLLDSINVL